VEQIAAQRAEVAGDAILFVGIEAQVIQNIEVCAQDSFRFRARALAFAFTKGSRDSEQAIRDALHRRNHYDHLHALRRCADEAGCMAHTLGTQQGTTAELECDQRIASWRGCTHLGIGHRAHTCNIIYGD
jgi:hypothetical protein